MKCGNTLLHQKGFLVPMVVQQTHPPAFSLVTMLTAAAAVDLGTVHGPILSHKNNNIFSPHTSMPASQVNGSFCQHAEGKEDSIQEDHLVKSVVPCFICVPEVSVRAGSHLVF